jgi:hypothetical protein
MPAISPVFCSAFIRLDKMTVAVMTSERFLNALLMVIGKNQRQKL